MLEDRDDSLNMMIGSSSFPPSQPLEVAVILLVVLAAVYAVLSEYAVKQRSQAQVTGNNAVSGIEGNKSVSEAIRVCSEEEIFRSREARRHAASLQKDGYAGKCLK